MWTEPFESTTVNHGSLDESIQALTDILSDEYDRYDGGGWYLATEEEIRNAIGYLKEYRDLRAILPDKLIGYFGNRPVVEVDGHYFAIRYYDRNSKAWRCDRVEESPITKTWVCADDDTYVIDNSGTILYREVGWDMRKEPYEKGKVSK